ncbi:hypothetical protein EAH88_11730 [Rhodanobacter glycinis]|uniref:Uncharacterized protein n=1 Tax=Rhodanobacter glycinis TaxID=582702 RepID=A0A502C550_9GAMM|nr:hypothetical protein [Rhodanobacter glycinis]TPG08297.1 hypothetical protein EAH88_11730 [Rhodanobacter glycinis]
MDALPHIGQTLKQRALLRYQLLQHELEVERRERIDAALQVDAMLDRVSQPEPCQFCAVEEVPAPVPLWLLVLGATLWTAVLVIGLGLVAVQCGWIA